MSLTPTIALALLGAVGFGATSATAIAVSMEVVQRELRDHQRVLAFTAFHVIIRAGLSFAAITAGVVEDLFDHTRWSLVGSLESSQVVLLSSGLLVVVVAVASAAVVPSAGGQSGVGPNPATRQ
jgi:MFS family permease